MKKTKSRVAPAALAVAVSAAVYGYSVQAADIHGLNSKNIIPGQYIVKFKDSSFQGNGVLMTSRSMADDLNRVYGARVETTIDHVFKGAVMVMNLAAAKRLANDPHVEYIEADQVMSVIATQNNPTWGLDRIDQASLPLSNTYTYGPSDGVHAYILDTGIRGTHTEFTGRMGNGYTSINDGNGTNDCHGHGTHVAGTVGGTVYGVAKGVKLYPVRVLGCSGSGSNSGVVAGMDWVQANAVRPAVANMSLGGGASQATDDAVARMTNSGITVVVAAGNNNANACNYSPARAPSAITVGSTTNTDARSSFSNYGSCVDIYAPGSNILSASNGSNTATATLSGTSMASPHVAGAAALYLKTNTGASPATVTSALVNNAGNNKISGIPSGANKLLSTVFLNSTPPPPGIPSAPSSVSVISEKCYGFNWVNLSAVSGATSYQIYSVYSPSSTSGSLLKTITDTSTDISVTSQTYIKAKACNSYGCSAMSTSYGTAQYYNYCM